MKKDRNCGNYPIYQPNMMNPMMPNMMVPPTMMPSMGNPMMPSAQAGSCPMSSGNTDSLTQQVNSLERRVSRLENLVNGTNNSVNYASKYSDSNYHMM